MPPPTPVHGILRKQEEPGQAPGRCCSSASGLLSGSREDLSLSVLGPHLRWEEGDRPLPELLGAEGEDVLDTPAFSRDGDADPQG